MRKKKIVGLIPARAGSVRVRNKNIRTLDGHPLIAYTIVAALESDIFDDVVVCTDNSEYAAVAAYYGAVVPFLRPHNISSETSPDIEWVEYALDQLRATRSEYEYFSILRPTNPFRKPETIKRAWQQLQSTKNADTLRAVEKCSQHPGKMWVPNGEQIEPIMPYEINGQPWHSNQYASLPEVWVQNGSLEITKSFVVNDFRKITGNFIVPFFTQNNEGFDINSETDFIYAENMVSENPHNLVKMKKKAYNKPLKN